MLEETFDKHNSKLDIVLKCSGLIYFVCQCAHHYIKEFFKNLANFEVCYKIISSNKHLLFLKSKECIKKYLDI